jgi:drug/metabolite transporter (DMT)-like permease
LAAGAAASFGVITTIARIAYDHGASPAAVMELRFLAAALVMALIAGLSGRSFALPRRLWPRAIGVALGNFGVTLGYLFSVAYIPVSLAALIFYTYPLMVAAAVPFMERSRLGALAAIAFLLAFAGLALALGPPLAELDWRGVAWALLAAASAVLLFLLSPRLMAECDSVVVSCQVNLFATVLLVPPVLLMGGFALPAAATGWAAIAGASAFHIAGTLAMFAAFRLTGAARAALVFNVEPLVAIAAAAALLGESLTLVQLAGVAMVMAALMLATRLRFEH